MEPRSIDFLTPQEARVVRDKIHELRPMWSKQAAQAQFYLLGTSAYIEGQTQGGLKYTFAAKRTNPLLESHFGDLYERLRAALEASLGEPVRYSAKHALPGFHVFLDDPTFSLPVCKIHIDLPYDQVDWPSWEEIDRTQTLSFTLSIALPESGAGLNIWEQIPPADARVGASLEEQTKGLEPTFHRYAVGRMVLHDGHSVHQIAPFKTAPGEERTTLQGHAVRTPRGWIAYF